MAKTPEERAVPSEYPLRVQEGDAPPVRILEELAACCLVTQASHVAGVLT